MYIYAHMYICLHIYVYIYIYTWGPIWLGQRLRGKAGEAVVTLELSLQDVVKGLPHELHGGLGGFQKSLPSKAPKERAPLKGI